MFHEERQKLLIVDDIPGNIRILAEILKQNYELIMATNGADALVATRNEHPDLILLDVYMPGMNGFEVCQKLKADEAMFEIPVIFVTAAEESVNETRGLEIGGVDYITKPLNASVVKARVETHLRLKKSHQALKIKNQELQDAHHMLEQQNQQLREIVQLREDIEQIMRHDLKAPLTSIIGFSDILRHDLKMNDEHAAMCDMVVEASYKLLDQINISLDLYKMEKGIFELDPKPVDLVRLLNKVISTARPLCNMKKINIQLLINQQPIPYTETFFIIGDELLCYSIFNNLIKNALEASPNMENIEISLMRAEQAIIKITNVGAVPETIRERFFEKYVSSGKKGGTGLGTYSSKLMVENQKGRIILEPPVGKRTTVTLYLQPC